MSLKEEHKLVGKDSELNYKEILVRYIGNTHFFGLVIQLHIEVSIRKTTIYNSKENKHVGFKIGQRPS